MARMAKDIRKCKEAGMEMTCKYCRKKRPLSEFKLTFPRVCVDCVPLYFEENKSKILQRAKRHAKSEENRQNRKAKEAIMTKSEWLKRLQYHFNRYIRKRDAGKPCISCGKPLGRNFDAGHLFTVGAHPELRFDEDNVHGQCVACNQHLHGNTANYLLNLPERIGRERFEAFLDRKNKPQNLTIQEIRELIKIYKEKAKN